MKVIFVSMEISKRGLFFGQYLVGHTIEDHELFLVSEKYKLIYFECAPIGPEYQLSPYNIDFRRPLQRELLFNKLSKFGIEFKNMMTIHTCVCNITDEGLFNLRLCFDNEGAYRVEI
jgi:hypothetical protein